MPELSEGHTESEKFNVINIPMLVSLYEKIKCNLRLRHACHADRQHKRD